MAAEFDSNGKIKGYADLKVQVGKISTTVTNNKSAADAAFRTITDDLDAEESARKSAVNGLRDDLDGEISNRQSFEDKILTRPLGYIRTTTC